MTMTPEEFKKLTKDRQAKTEKRRIRRRATVARWLGIVGVPVAIASLVSTWLLFKTESLNVTLVGVPQIAFDPANTTELIQGPLGLTFFNEGTRSSSVERVDIIVSLHDNRPKEWSSRDCFDRATFYETDIDKDKFTIKEKESIQKSFTFHFSRFNINEEETKEQRRQIIATRRYIVLMCQRVILVTPSGHQIVSVLPVSVDNRILPSSLETIHLWKSWELSFGK
jgi:hypothetical protein